MPFGALGLCDELLKAIAEQGYTAPSPVQLEAIPAVLSERDVIAIARTGTGKTAGFTLPILQHLSNGPAANNKSIRALIITPTRELAAQVAQSVQTYSQHLNIRSAAIFGGVRIEAQITELQNGLDILIATPGRLLDLHNQQAVNFDQLEILVLDEADRMLDLGFIDDIRHLQTLLPSKRQTLLFSATLSKEIKSLADKMLIQPQLIAVTAANSTTESVQQIVHPVDKLRKRELLIHLINQGNWQQALVFIRTKKDADDLALQLINAAISAESIHSNRSQHARTAALEGFKSGEIRVLVATDIAARGIDINELPIVINLDLPYVAEDYVHRIGRTGRAGNSGLAISLVSQDEVKQLKAIHRIINRKIQTEVIKGFEPTDKPVVKPSKYSDDEYGNFEADTTPKKRGRSRRRKRR